MKRLKNDINLLRQILNFSDCDLSNADLVSQILNIIIDFSGSDFVSIFWKNNGNIYSYEINKDHNVRFNTVPNESNLNNPAYTSSISLPLVIDNSEIGSLSLMSNKDNYFCEADREQYHDLAISTGFVLKNHKVQSDLKERVKELTCLYGISKIVEKKNLSIEKTLQEIVSLLPPAFQYPEIAFSQIILDEKKYNSDNFQESSFTLSSPVMIRGMVRGDIRVGYLDTKFKAEKVFFLKEEQSLINTIAQQISLIIERKQTEEERLKLHRQLRHADRLATIGQLSAGVAHELNEPLGSILGFAQLLTKDKGLPEQASMDISEIIKASLHAREIIRKLMLFSKQLPPMTSKVDLNNLIKEDLYFLKSRCNKENIKLIDRLDPELPRNIADKSQLHQVLVNLVVNAIQAMPDGGEITINTRHDDKNVFLAVSDTGIGMEEKIIKQIFVPFFTTKEVSQGTGLGLSVVHGIITAHHGSIDVKSKVGKGSVFEVRLPISPDGEEA